jgi:hypothetical protein
VQLADFRALVERLVNDVPPKYLDGVVAVEVSHKTLPHPVRGDIYTLGECIPLEWSGDGSDLQSRVVLYHGSFQALAKLGALDWREEAWETLTHELRHHLEWRAKVAALERYDWAAEQNFARHEGERFDPAFYRSGEEVAPGIFRVDDDVFIELATGDAQRGGTRVGVEWHGRRYRVTPPRDLKRPAFLLLEGLHEPPPGDAVLVFPGRASLLQFWRRPAVTKAAVKVVPLDD